MVPLRKRHQPRKRATLIEVICRFYHGRFSCNSLKQMLRESTGFREHKRIMFLLLKYMMIVYLQVKKDHDNQIII